MAKKSVEYVCQTCGSVYARWQGHCTACDEWNTIVEERVTSEGNAKSAAIRKKSSKIELVGLEGNSENVKERLITGIGELDRVCGGGLVAGSVLLVGGDPGIGKSTLLLQVSGMAAKLASKPKCVYISGEESIDQVRMRAQRLGFAKADVQLAAATNAGDIIATLDAPDSADIVVIDSIQTMFLENIDSAPGTVSQVRAVGHELIRLAKKRGFVLFLVGHVTKQGTIAGPRVIEHMVDTVLYFEGDRGHQFRILRAVKNRFGATDEIGVFEMSDKGLSEVANPSALFLAERRGNISGSCVFAGMEGTRPMLVEIQALVNPSSGAAPRRAVVGWDSNRLSMILAVLEARCGLRLGMHDVYLNVAGGLKIAEPAADAAVAAAVVSSVFNMPVPADMVVMGEIGLSGEIRAVPQTAVRLKEAAKLGFKESLIPLGVKNKQTSPNSDFKLFEIGHLQKLVEMFKSEIE